MSVANSAGLASATSWSPVRRASNWATEVGHSVLCANWEVEECPCNIMLLVCKEWQILLTENSFPSFKIDASLIIGLTVYNQSQYIHTQTYTKILLGCCPHDYHWQIKLNCMFVWKIYVMVIYNHADLVIVTSECCVKRFPVKRLGLSIQRRPTSDVEKQGIWAGSALFV